jgi:hypothetical protein
MALDDIDAGDDDARLLREGSDHFALLALVLAGEDHNLVPFLDVE